MQILDAPQNQIDYIPYASFGKRFAASIIDGFLIGLITSFLINWSYPFLRVRYCI